MRYRAFGTTGLQVSELVIGGGAVGGLLINKDDKTKLETVRRALDAGINWIDTAASYGQGRSEEAIGWILKEVDSKPYISTKFSIDTRNLGDLRGQVERSVHESLARLDTGSVTLLQLHNQLGAETAGRVIGVHEVLKDQGVLDVLDDLKAQGLFDHFGITGLGETGAVVSVIETGRIASTQVYFNLLNPSAVFEPPSSWPCFNFNGIVDACLRNGVAPMNIRVFSAGVIATDDRHGRERPLTPGDTVDSETEKAHRIFDQIGLQFGSRAQTAIRFALAQPGLACVVFGLAEPEHLEEALEAQSMGPLPEAALAEINACYRV